MALLDLPGNILVQIMAHSSLEDAHAMVCTCRHLYSQILGLKAVHAATRALVTCKRPGRNTGISTQHVLQHVQATPAAAAYAQFVATPEQVLLNPDLAHWIMQYAGLNGDWRAVDWLVQVHDVSAAMTSRKAYHKLWDRAWLSAAGHAAAGQRTALLAALMAQPCAPGQSAGLRQLTAELQAQLLCGAMSGPDPAAALAAVYPLCMLPASLQPLAADEQRTTADEQRAAARQEALLGAGKHAMCRGHTEALMALATYGLDIQSHSRALMLQALVNDQADALRHLASLDQSDGPVSRRAIHHTWQLALVQDRPHCLAAMLDVAPWLFNPKVICNLAERSVLPPGDQALLTLARRLLSHPNVPRAAVQEDTRLLATAVQVGSKAFTTLLLDYGCPLTARAIFAACKYGRPEVLQLLLDRAATGWARVQKLLRPHTVAKGLLIAAGEHEQAVGGLEHVRRRATPAGQCAQLLLDHLLSYCGAPPALHCILMGYKASDGAQLEAWKQSCDATGCMEEEAGAGSWPVVLQALLLLRETKLVAAVLALPCLVTLRADQSLLEQAARSCAATPSRSPALLVELVRRGAEATAALQAVVKTLDMKLLLNVLAAFRSEHVLMVPGSASSGFVAGLDAKNTQALNPGWEDDWTVWAAASEAYLWGMDLAGLQWAEQAAHHAAQHTAATGCATAREVLRLLIVHHGVAASAGLVIPGAEGQARSKHHYAHLKWLLHLAGAEHLHFSKATAVKSVTGTNMSTAEQLARWAPLPFVMLAAAHRVAPILLLAGLCQRPQPPLYLISQLLMGDIPSVGCTCFREPANQPVTGTAALVAASALNWRQGRLLQLAVCGQSVELVDLLISCGATQLEALQCPNPNLALLMHIVRNHYTDADGGALCMILSCPGRQQLVTQLLAAGIDAGEVLIAASKVGCVHTVALLVDIYGVDPSVFLDQPVVLAAQHGHQPVLELLVSRGASLHAALYGAVLGGAEHMVKYLTEAGADPQWDDGAQRR